MLKLELEAGSKVWLVGLYQPHFTSHSGMIQFEKFGSFIDGLDSATTKFQFLPHHDKMLSRMVRRRLLSSALRTRSPPGKGMQRRWLTPAPRPGDGPLMTRRADRELPSKNQPNSLHS